jgi:two-component sensor histidine kinase
MRELDARFLESERALIRAAREACLRGEAPYRNEHAMIRSDGRVIRVLDRGDVVARDSSGAPLRMVGSFSDITAQSDARDLIARSLREKEVLLKEIHHRVKNNLQIISSLISMQADSTRDERARGPLLESAARVRSMALIHRQLYASSDLAHIDLGASAHALASELLASLAPDARADVDVENVAVTVEQAVPCALLLNELLSNAAKHGRSEDGTLAVRVEVKRVDGEVMLAVSDRGPGLPEQVTFERGHSLGMTLVRALARQLRATIRAERREGTRVELRIKAEAS